MSNLNETVIKAAHAMLMKFNNRFSKNQRETEAILLDWADHLASEKGYTVTQIGYALSELTRQGRTFMPNAYEISEILSPAQETKEDIAPVVVAEMIRALRFYGKFDERRMLESVSEEARMAFVALGDTNDIRMSENYETTKAQLERLVKGVMSMRDRNEKNGQLFALGITGGKGLKKISFDHFTL